MLWHIHYSKEGHIFRSAGKFGDNPCLSFKGSYIAIIAIHFMKSAIPCARIAGYGAMFGIYVIRAWADSKII